MLIAKFLFLNFNKMNYKKIIASSVLATFIITSTALAASDNLLPKLPQGPIYSLVNEAVEFKTGLSLEDIKTEIQNGTLKETLEAKGIDVEGLQAKFREKANEALNLNAIEAKIVHTDDGAQLQLSSDNEKFLNRISIMQARAEYFNANHEDAPFNLSAEKEDNTIYLSVHGEDEDAIAKIQDRMFESK